MPPRLPEQPVGQRILVVVQLAGAFAGRVGRFDGLVGQVFANRIPEQAGAGVISRIGMPSRRCQRRITLNNATSITPWCPCICFGREGLYVGQNSMQIRGAKGSILGAIQHTCSRTLSSSRHFWQTRMYLATVWRSDFNCGISPIQKEESYIL